MIVLSGNITYFNLSGLLRFLYSNKLTGILHIRKKDSEVDVYILSGKTTGVEPALGDPIDKMVEVSMWINGEFSFELTKEDQITRNLTVPHDKLTLLIAKKEKEYKEIKNSLPPLNSILEMSPAEKIGEIRLQPDEWNLLSKVDGKRSLEEIVHLIDLDELSVFAMVVRMMQRGILSVLAPEGSPDQKTEKEPTLSDSTERDGGALLTKEKTSELEKIFMRFVGPMGTIMMDEIFEGMRLNRGDIPLAVLPDLVEKMSKEIDSEEDRQLFDDQALELLGLKNKK